MYPVEKAVWRNFTVGSSLLTEGHKMSDTLFQRLDAEEGDVRKKLDRLRSEIVSLEERLAHLAITRRTAVQLLGDPPADEAPSQAVTPETEEAVEEQVDDSQTAPRPDEPLPPPGPVAEESASRSSRKEKRSTSDRQPRLGPVSKKILLLVSSSDRPLRARDVAIALGHTNPKRTQVESTRTALQKLVDQKYLTKIEQGLFAGANGSAKGAA